ncbi:uncharacterized protein LOC110272951 [Arachis duranensis]|uniref:Uncharacterized protein LOC110272951 n=1 Tax=Arachis duranensis TaxID=130453 RepID=A0A9C6TM58_ARADU|nr:uncharacterized protein LOC110272951 [Arachis duranensis]
MANAAIDIEFSGEEPPESLFMKKLKRRGMTPTSLLEDYKQGNSGVDEEVVVNEQDRGLSRRNVVSTDVERSLKNPHNRRILFSSLLVCTMLQYFGPTFVHDASKMSLSPPQYVDPYALLEDASKISL